MQKEDLFALAAGLIMGVAAIYAFNAGQAGVVTRPLVENAAATDAAPPPVAADSGAMDHAMMDHGAMNHDMNDGADAGHDAATATGSDAGSDE